MVLRHLLKHYFGSTLLNNNDDTKKIMFNTRKQSISRNANPQDFAI